MPYIETQSGKVYYECQGRGDTTFLLLHGWCDNSRVFSALAPKLASTARVLTLDWPGHGRSDLPGRDFGYDDLVSAAREVLLATGSTSVVPVAVSHAGWVAIELARLLSERVHRLVLMDWIVLDPPPPFVEALDILQQEPQAAFAVRDALFAMWKGPVPVRSVEEHIELQMRPTSHEMWARAGREIGRAYRANGNPLQQLKQLPAPIPTLQLYSQPMDPGYLAAQRAFAEHHRWFSVLQLDGKTHFPCLEAPETSADAIRAFVQRV